MTIISIRVHHIQFARMRGLYISGAIKSPPTTYITPALRVVRNNLVIGLICEVAVIVAMAVNAQRMFKAVNLWLAV